MPLTRDLSLPLQASFTLSDNNGKNGLMGFWLPNALTVTEAGTYIASLETALIGLSDARVERATITLTFTQDVGYTYIAPPSSEVERKLSVRFLDATGFYGFKSEVPSPRFTLEVDGSNNVPITNPALSLFADAVVNGPIGPGNGGQTYGGRDLTRIDSAVVIHRNRKP